MTFFLESIFSTLLLLEWCISLVICLIINFNFASEFSFFVHSRIVWGWAVKGLTTLLLLCSHKGHMNTWNRVQVFEHWLCDFMIYFLHLKFIFISYCWYCILLFNIDLFLSSMKYYTFIAINKRNDTREHYETHIQYLFIFSEPIILFIHLIQYLKLFFIQIQLLFKNL